MVLAYCNDEYLFLSGQDQYTLDLEYDWVYSKLKYAYNVYYIFYYIINNILYRRDGDEITEIGEVEEGKYPIRIIASKVIYQDYAYDYETKEKIPHIGELVSSSCDDIISKLGDIYYCNGSILFFKGALTHNIKNIKHFLDPGLIITNDNKVINMHGTCESKIINDHIYTRHDYNITIYSIKNNIGCKVYNRSSINWVDSNEDTFLVQNQTGSSYISPRDGTSSVDVDDTISLYPPVQIKSARK
jgi:hypothetical protein